MRRARFTAAEVVELTLDFYRRDHVEGLFLSSGIVGSPDHTMARLVEVARTLRRDHGFAGYVHPKTIPAASPGLVDEAGRWADRLSIDVELPSQDDLDRLAPEKRLVQIGGAVTRIRDRIDEAKDEAGRRGRSRRPASRPAARARG